MLVDPSQYGLNYHKQANIYMIIFSIFTNKLKIQKDGNQNEKLKVKPY